MVESLHEDNKRRKEIIVSNSPLLRVFVDKYAEGDPDMWLKMVNTVFDEKKKEMVNVMGRDKVNLDLGALLRVANEYKVFPEDSVKLALTACFVWMGFEIGNNDDAYLFIDDISNQLLRFSTINNTFDSRSFICEGMVCGVSWKNGVGDDTPKEFRDFISKINF